MGSRSFQSTISYVSLGKRSFTFRVIVRRIKEVDTAVNRRLDQFIGPGLVNRADGLEEPSAVPECHGSEAKFRNQETRITERCVFHDVPFLASPKFPWREGGGRWHGRLPSLEPLHTLTSATGDGDLAFEANPGDLRSHRRCGV